MLLPFEGNVNTDVSVLTCPFLSRISADRQDWLLMKVCLEQGECWAPEYVGLVPNSAKCVAYSLAMCHFFPCLTCLLSPCCQWQFALHKEERHYPEGLQLFFPPAFIYFFPMEFLSKKQIPWWVLFFFFFFFLSAETCLFLSRLFHVDMMGLGCTAAPPSPCSQLRRLGSAWLPSPGGYYPRGSIWLLAGSVGSHTGRVWSSLLALSCGNLSVGSSGSLVLSCAFYF